MQSSVGIFFTFHKAHLVGQRLLERGWLQQGISISMSQYLMLEVISKLPNNPTKALAEYVGCTRATLTRILRGLVILGYLTKEKSEDRRFKPLSLSPAGEEILKQATGWAHKASNLLKPLYTKTQLAQVQEFVDGWTNNLNHEASTLVQWEI